VSVARHDPVATPVAGPPAASRAVAWLRSGADAGGAGDAAAAARPPQSLDAEECLALAAVVLDGIRRPEPPAGESRADPATRGGGADLAGLGRRLAEATGRIAALAGWLDARSPAPPGGDDRSVLERLAASLAFADPSPADGQAAAGCALAAGEVLRQAVAVALEHVRLREDFQGAVAEARLEAMRELAYGAGHEINNPLANIATRAQALLLEESDPERRRRLATIVDQSFRARDMIGGLMVFARPPKPHRGAADVGRLLAAVIEAVRGQAVARGVRLEYSPSPTPRSACVDHVQVEEAVRVVVLNALEAVEPGGRVLIGVDGRRSGQRDWVEITISDDGRGMSPDEAKRAFDPFYSGREAGRGVGLGLPKAWRLIDASGGGVVLDSRRGQGTRATITLPVTDAAAPAGE